MNCLLPLIFNAEEIIVLNITYQSYWLATLTKASVSIVYKILSVCVCAAEVSTKFCQFASP